MQIPERVPGLKWLTAAWGVYGVVWIALEGVLWQTVLLAVGTTAVTLLSLIQKYLAGRTWSLGWWLAGTAVAGLTFGLFSGLLTLFFMALKTGLHAHGPEFTPAEIAWVLGQLRLWTAVGLLAGLGLGLLTWGLGRNR
jgi:hypothetical protein